MNKTEFEEYLVKRAKSPEPFIPTRFKGLNDIIDGMYEGAVIGIGAWPGHGKTTLALNLMAGMEGHKVSVFDTEMTKYRYMELFVGMLTGTEDKKVRTRPVDILDEIIPKLGVLDKYDLHIIDSSSPTIQEIETEVKTNNPRFLVIDYFQNIAIVNPLNRYAEYTSHARKIEDLAKKYQLTVILLSQFKKPESGVTKPTLFDFKETGKLAEMMHIALLLSRSEDGMVVDVAKNRMAGVLGTVKLNGDWTTNKLF